LQEHTINSEVKLSPLDCLVVKPSAHISTQLSGSQPSRKLIGACPIHRKYCIANWQCWSKRQCIL